MCIWHIDCHVRYYFAWERILSSTKAYISEIIFWAIGEWRITMTERSQSHVYKQSLKQTAKVLEVPSLEGSLISFEFYLKVIQVTYTSKLCQVYSILYFFSTWDIQLLIFFLEAHLTCLKDGHSTLLRGSTRLVLYIFQLMLTEKCQFKLSYFNIFTFKHVLVSW